MRGMCIQPKSVTKSKEREGRGLMKEKLKSRGQERENGMRGKKI